MVDKSVHSRVAPTVERWAVPWAAYSASYSAASWAVPKVVWRAAQWVEHSVEKKDHMKAVRLVAQMVGY